MANALCFDVVGLGQCSFDILGRVSSFPLPDQKTELDELKFQGGGPVATALVTLSRLDVATAYLGRIGDDDFGAKIRAGLQEEGVDCNGLLVDAGATSQVAFIAVDGGGRRNIFWHRGSARPLLAEELDYDIINNARVLHLDGLQQEATLAAAQYAREHGVVTVLDGGSLRDGSLDLLLYIDHPVVSEKFAEQLLPGGVIEEKLAKLLEYGGRAVTVTLGDKGSWSQERGGEPFLQPAFDVEVVDTTGCGDVYHGGYVYGLLQNWELPRIVRFASACAALKARKLGGRSAIPNLIEINNYLNNN